MRCSWVNLDNPLYMKYHDEEWGVPKYNDNILFEFLILEIFEAGLSWETILNKRDNFRKAFANFDCNKISKFDEIKINSLLNDEGIIRNRSKIKATIINAQVFLNIQKEYSSFSNYIWHFTNNKVVFSNGTQSSNKLSDEVTLDLKNKGMKFIGTKIIYSYLAAIGVIYDHEECCKLFKKTL